jgi:hypothetical protein
MSEERASLTLTESRSVDDWRFRALGLLPLLFFLAQGIHYGRLNQLGHMLWMCNIGNLLLALGLLTGRPLLIRVAAVWTIPGLIMWLLFVVGVWGIIFASVLAHVGGLIVGLIALRRVRINPRDWVYAFGWYLLLQLASRWFTPIELNVNVSQKMYSGWEQRFGSFWTFWLVMSLLVGLMLWVLTLGLSKLWPLKTEPGRGFVGS